MSIAHKMQIPFLISQALLFRLIHTQSTAVSPTAYVGLVPDYPDYIADASGVYTAISNTTNSAPVRDPCGPLNQPSPNPAGDTCNVSVIQSIDPAPYGVQCLKDHSRVAHINFTACSLETIPAICDKLADPAVQTGVWIWASAADTTGVASCFMGFFLPPYSGSAPKPSREKCVEDIFRPMAGYCNPATGYLTTEGMYNLATVNVKEKPNGDYNGQAVDVGYPSYAMATRQLTV